MTRISDFHISSTFKSQPENDHRKRWIYNEWMLLWFAFIIPFCTVVLATKYSHFFVVKKGNSSQCSFLGVVNVATDVFCWKKKTNMFVMYSERPTL